MVKKLRARNFLALALVAAFLLVVLILGWRVWRRGESAPVNNSLQLSSTYVDTAGRFSFNYPRDWTVFYMEPGGSSGPIEPEPNWAEISRPVLIEPRDGKQNDVVVTPGCSAGTIAELKANSDRFHTQQDVTINGYGAFYDRLDFRGDAESYLDHIYVILGGTDCLQFRYRENHHHPMSGTDYDNSANMPVLQAILQSVRFVQ